MSNLSSNRLDDSEASLEQEDLKMEEYSLPTEEWLVAGFERNLGVIKAGGSIEHVKTIQRSSETDIADHSDEQASLYEKAIMEVYSLRDWMIEEFQRNVKFQSTSSVLEKAILKSESIIRTLGGDVEAFNPLNYMSGLDEIGESDVNSNTILANARAVIENTKKHYVKYKLSSIEAKMIKGKPGIVFSIEGDDNNSPFKVVGAVVSKKNFFGNEAIDYVRHNGNGALGIKALSGGKWKDVGQDFHIAVETRPQT